MTCLFIFVSETKYLKKSLKYTINNFEYILIGAEGKVQRDYQYNCKY